MILILGILKTTIITLALSSISEFIGELLSNYHFENKILQFVLYIISYILICSRCFSFWFTLIYTGSLLIASITSLIIYGISLIPINIKTQV